LGAFFAAEPQKTGLSAPIFLLRKKYFRFYPLRGSVSDTGLSIKSAHILRNPLARGPYRGGAPKVSSSTANG
jgi:hypothetical protein